MGWLRGPTALSTTLIILLSALLPGCYGLRPSRGGGETSFSPPRVVNPGDVLVPPGYRIEAVATGLTFPTGIAFDEAGTPYVVESGYSYGEVWTTPRLLGVGPEGKVTQVASGGRNGPWTGVAYHSGSFFVAEGGELEGGRLLRIAQDGKVTILAQDLPSRGDHHTNGPAVGPDGWIYFGIGTATNSGIVGEDNFKFGWLRRNPSFCDIPCQDVTVSGQKYVTADVFHPASVQQVATGPFSPFGTAPAPNTVVRGALPCSGSILRVRVDGGASELVAWGLRNPFGLAFAPNGRLYATENQYDTRGSRPVFGAGDLLWEVEPGAWYGWPDYHGVSPLYEGTRYKPPGEEPPSRLLAKDPGPPRRPVALFEAHSSSSGFDFSRSADFGHAGQAFVAQFGDQAPETEKVLSPLGFKVVRVDVQTGNITDFAVNRGEKNGPASALRGGGLERPIAARFDPGGTSLYVVDFGVMTMGKEGPRPVQGTGVLWRIARVGGAVR